jgi:hypothetical protein
MLDADDMVNLSADDQIGLVEQTVFTSKTGAFCYSQAYFFGNRAPHAT